MPVEETVVAILLTNGALAGFIWYKFGKIETKIESLERTVYKRTP